MFDPVLIHDYLLRCAARHPEKPALICGDERLTYGGLASAALSLGHVLADAGVAPRDRVAVYLDNSSEAVISLFGALLAGGTFVLLDGTMKPSKLKYIIRDSGAAVLITHTSKAPIVQAALEQSGSGCSVLWAGEEAHAPAELNQRSRYWREVREQPHRPAGGTLRRTAGGKIIDVDLAALIYTSGSTGEPKGVMSSHQNMVSAARSIISYLRNTPDDIILNALPLSFDYGLYQVIMSVMFGGTVVLERSFAFPVKVLERISREQVTGFPIVPTIAALLLRMKDLHRHDLRSLRYVTNTAAALPVEHIQQLRKKLPHVALFSMYGLTECKRVAYLPPEELDHRPSSVGKAIPNTEVTVLREDGSEAAPGETGELVVRGSHVMQGYWRSPELTQRVFRTGKSPGERLLFTGDLFRKDEEGFLYFIGRKDDMIKSKGERISPREIENTLCGLEGVAEAAVLGVPDEILGEAILACVVLAPGAGLTGPRMQKHCAENLQPFMVPKFIRIMDSLPRTPNNKIDKKELKRQQSENAEEARAAN